MAAFLAGVGGPFLVPASTNLYTCVPCMKVHDSVLSLMLRENMAKLTLGSQNV